MDPPWGHIEHPRNDLEADSLLGRGLAWSRCGFPFLVGFQKLLGCDIRFGGGSGWRVFFRIQRSLAV